MANDNIVSILLQILGGQQAATDVAQVSQKMQELQTSVKAAMESGIAADVAMAQKAVQLEKTAQSTKVLSETTSSLKQGMQNFSETLIGGVTPALDQGVKQLLAMAAAGLTVKAAFDGVKDALDYGSHLERLSLITGDSVKNLVIEEQAFKNAGLSAINFRSAAMMLDRALNPLGEASKKNSALLREMGISMADIRAASFTDQLQMINAGMSKLPDQASRLAASLQLFGRYAGGQMLPLFGDPDSMALAVEQAGRMGDLMQRVAAVFNEVDKSLNVVKTRIMELWVATTEQLIPAFQTFASIVSGLNLSSVGGALPSIASGVGLIFSTALVARLDTAVLNWAEGSGAGAAFARTFIAPLTGVLTAMMTTVLPVLLVAAIIAGIIKGVEAYELNKINATDAAREEVYRTGKKQQATISGSTSQEDLDAHVKQVQAKLDVDTKALQELTQKKQQADEYKNRRYGTGKEASFSADDQEALDLAAKRVQFGVQALSHLPTPDALNANKLKQANLEFVATLGNIDELQAKTAALNLRQEDYAAKKIAAETEIARLEKQKLTDGAGLSPTQKAQADAGIDLAIAVQVKAREEAEVKITAEKTKQAKLEQAADQHIQQQMATDLELKIRETKAAGDIGELRKLEVSQLETKLIAQGANNVQIEREKVLLRGQWTEQDRAAAQAQAQIVATDALAASKARLAAIEANPFLSNVDKWPIIRAALDDEIAKNNELIRQLTIKRDLAIGRGDTSGADRAQHSINVATNHGIELDSQGAKKIDPNDFGANLSKQMADVRNQMQTLAQGMAGTITNALSSMNTGMTNAFNGWLNHTKSLKAGFADMALGMVQSLDQSLAKMASDWVIKHVFMDNIRRLFLAMGMTEERAAALFGVTVHATAEAAKTAATAGGAGERGAVRVGETAFHGIQLGLQLALHISVEIAKTAISLAQWLARLPILLLEFGVRVALAAISAAQSVASIPYVGPILAIVAAGLIVAEGAKLISGKGFKSGGFTGSGSDDEEAGKVHKNEFVWSAPAVRAVGLDNLQAAHAAATSGTGAGGSAAGSNQSGRRGGKTRDGSGDVHLGFFTGKHDTESWLKSRRGSRVMVDFLRQQKYQMD